jgi:hypothetical protein
MLPHDELHDEYPIVGAFAKCDSAGSVFAATLVDCSAHFQWIKSNEVSDAVRAYCNRHELNGLIASAAIILLHYLHYLHGFGLRQRLNEYLVQNSGQKLERRLKLLAPMPEWIIHVPWHLDPILVMHQN